VDPRRLIAVISSIVPRTATPPASKNPGNIL
jgi:hypothetical protein